MPLFNIDRTPRANFFQFGKHRIELDARAEHAFMSILKHGEHGSFTGADGQVWELNPDGEGRFHISKAGGQTVATIGGQTAIDLIHDLRAIIMGA